MSVAVAPDVGLTVASAAGFAELAEIDVGVLRIAVPSTVATVDVFLVPVERSGFAFFA